MVVFDIKIAIVIPVYNGQKYINDCLSSILAQSYKMWDAYVVDDGSTDGSLKILEQYSFMDRRIHVFHTDNHGAAAARNFAMSLIKSEGKNTWISFVDIDDYLAPEFYQEIVKNLSETKDNIDFVRLFSILTNNRQVESCHVAKYDIGNVTVDPTDYFLTQSVAGYTHSNFINHTLIEKGTVRFPENMRIMEDQVFSISCAMQAEKILILNNMRGYYYYKANEKSISHVTKDTSKDIINCCNNVYRSFVGGKNYELLEKYFYSQYFPTKFGLLISTLFNNMHNGASCNIEKAFCFKIPAYNLLIKNRKVLFKYVILKMLRRI